MTYSTSFARKLECSLEMGEQPTPVIEELVVGSGNKTDGDMEINAEVHVHAGDLAATLALRDRRIAAICGTLRKYLEAGKFMIVLNDMPAREQSLFWHDLWTQGLGQLVGDGLVLVKMIDEENNNAGRRPDEPPARTKY